MTKSPELLFPPRSEFNTAASVSRQLDKKEQQHAWEVELLAAIKNKDARAAQTLFDAGLKMPKTLDGQRAVNYVLKHFDPAVAKVLSQNGIIPNYPSTILRDMGTHNNAEMAQWVRSILDSSEITRASLALYPIIWNSHDQTLEQMLSWPEIDDKTKVDSARGIFSLGVRANNHALMAFGFAAVAQSTSKNKVDPVADWLWHDARSADYEHILNLQSFLTSTPKAHAQWKARFPISIGDRGAKLKCTTLLDVLVVLRANVLPTLLRHDALRTRLIEILANPNMMSACINAHNGKAPILEIVRPIVDQVGHVRDKYGNNIAHMIVSAHNGRPPKALADDLVSLKPDWMMEENVEGKTPVDGMRPELQAHINRRLIKKTLNANKTGLVNNKKNTSRRM